MTDEDRQRCLAVLKTQAQFRPGSLRRRQFLRLCASAGMGLSSFYLPSARAQTLKTPPTAARVAGTTGPGSAAEPLTDQQKLLSDMGESFGGTTLRVLSEDTPPSVATREIMKHEFIPPFTVS
jgi:hypothetical protein